jgi:hypothetical protein
MAATTMIVSAPAPANEVLKALVALLKLAETVEIVEQGNNHGEVECKLELSELHPLQSSNDDGPKTKTTTLIGWTACIKRLCQSTVLWDAQRSLQVEEWIQAAATALLNGQCVNVCLFLRIHGSIVSLERITLTEVILKSCCGCS